LSRLVVTVLSRFINPLKLVTLVLQAAASGAFGTRVARGYGWLRGKKSWIVAGLAGVSAAIVELRGVDPAACAQVGCDSLEAGLQRWGPIVVGYLGGMTVSALDEALRTPPPPAAAAPAPPPLPLPLPITQETPRI